MTVAPACRIFPAWGDQQPHDRTTGTGLFTSALHCGLSIRSRNTPLKYRASSTVRRIGHKRPPCYLRRGPGGLPYKFLLLPDALGHAAVAVLHAVVEIIRRNGAKRLVVQALQSQPLLQILLELVQRLQLGRQRRLALPRRSAEEFLVAAIHQGSDLAAHQNAGQFRALDLAATLVQRDRAFALADQHRAIGPWRHAESRPFQVVESLLESDLGGALPPEEHTDIIAARIPPVQETRLTVTRFRTRRPTENKRPTASGGPNPIRGRAITQVRTYRALPRRHSAGPDAESLLRKLAARDFGTILIRGSSAPLLASLRCNTMQRAATGIEKRSWWHPPKSPSLGNLRDPA